MGDINYPCDSGNEVLNQCYSILSCYKIFHCDDFTDNGNCVTYYNYSLNLSSSSLDHIFLSNTIRKDITAAKVHDTGATFVTISSYLLISTNTSD